MSRRFAIVVILVLAAVYLAAVNDCWTVHRDTALYLSIGQSLVEGRGMEFNGAQEWGLPPFLPLLIAGCQWLTGTSHFWLINLAMKGFALGIAGLAYLLVRRMESELPAPLRANLAAAVLLIVGLSAQLYVSSVAILTDVPFTFFVTLGLYLFVRGRQDHWGWYVPAGLVLGVALFVRLPAVVFFGAAALAAAGPAIARRDGRRLAGVAIAGVIMLAAVLVWFLGLRALQSAGSFDYMSMLGSQPMDTKAPSKWASMLAGLNNIPSAISGSLIDQKMERWHFNLLPTALVAVGLATAARRRQWIVVAPVVLYLAFLVVTLGAPGVAARYSLPMMPLLAYAIVLGVRTLAVWVRPPAEHHTGGQAAGGTPVVATAARSPAPPWWGWAVVVLVVACLGTCLPKIGREVYWARHPQFYQVTDGGAWKDYFAVGDYLRQHGRPATDTVLGSSPTILYYLSGLPLAPVDTHGECDVAHKVWDDPAEFVRDIVQAKCHYVVIRTDDPEKQDWNAEAVKGLVASGRYAPEPKVFGRLAVYEWMEPAAPAM
jgi:4-amino-4-deoxy-L-arabinose transferase-like glycosyltransferase